MKKTIQLGVITSLLATSAFAGGIDRSGQGIGILFEEGRVISAGISFAQPEVTGTIAGGALETGDAAGDYNSKYFAIKSDYGSNYSLAVIYDEPFGAFADYPATGATGGLTAELKSSNITAIGKAKFGDRVSIFAGASLQFLEATLTDPATPYGVNADSSAGYGWLVGAAYEIPEYALRADVTYRSAITHKDIDIVEGGVFASQIDVTTPQSLNIGVQSGINDKTLVFASARWVDWSEFELSPTLYTLQKGKPLVSYDEDTITYTVGVGRKITDSFSLSASLGYEASQGGDATLLSPTDGRISYNLGGQYEVGNSKIQAGLSYVDIGDASVSSYAGSFTDNSAIGFGLKLTQSF